MPQFADGVLLVIAGVGVILEIGVRSGWCVAAGGVPAGKSRSCSQ